MPTSPSVCVPGTTRIGFVGTGVMGSSMAGRLREAGYDVTLTTRTREKASDLLTAGCRWADSAREVAAASDVCFAIVGFPSDVREVFLGHAGLLAGAEPGGVLVDMTTSRPELAVEIAEAAAARDVASLDAPVSGGDIGAREGRLSIMVGGDAAAFEAVRPCFEVMGRTIVRQGEAGAGQHCKMVNQTLIAGGMVAICEAMLYAAKAGLEPTTVLESVSSGAAGSWGLSNLGPRMIDGDFAPGFYVRHFLKDLGIALAEARRMQLCLPGLALAEQLYRAVQADGGGGDGTQALIRTLAKLSAVPWPPGAPQ